MIQTSFSSQDKWLHENVMQPFAQMFGILDSQPDVHQQLHQEFMVPFQEWMQQSASVDANIFYSFFQPLQAFMSPQSQDEVELLPSPVSKKSNKRVHVDIYDEPKPYFDSQHDDFWKQLEATNNTFGEYLHTPSRLLLNFSCLYPCVSGYLDEHDNRKAIKRIPSHIKDWALQSGLFVPSMPPANTENDQVVALDLHRKLQRVTRSSQERLKVDPQQQDTRAVYEEIYDDSDVEEIDDDFED